VHGVTSFPCACALADDGLDHGLRELGARRLTVLLEASGVERPCVKTHTSAKCRKHNSPARHRTSRVQYDLTLRDAIARRYFYVWRDRWSFRTAKNRSGRWRARTEPREPAAPVEDATPPRAIGAALACQMGAIPALDLDERPDNRLSDAASRRSMRRLIDDIVIRRARPSR
jgi:hypothetical protein